MRAEFSEFTYGFSLVSELATALACRAVPVFPSLKLEGQTGGGYDVEMDVGAVPFFLQFKLAEHLKTNNAKEAKLSLGALEAPYRRFQITSSLKSKQHEMLVGLGEQHEHVYYCAPDFWSNADLNHLWRHGFVSEQSVFVRSTDVGPITDGERHAVCYNRTSLAANTCYLFSIPQPLKQHSVETLRTAMAAALKKAETPLRALVPTWLESLTPARARASAMHQARIEAIEKSREEARRQDIASGATSSDDLEYRPLFAGRTLDRSDIPEEVPPVPSRVPGDDRTKVDPDRDHLSDFARQVAGEFQAQTFVLQRTA